MAAVTWGAARSGRSHLDLAGILLGVGKEIAQGFPGHIVIGDHHADVPRDDRDREEVLVFELCDVQNPVEQGVFRRHQQGVAVGRLVMDPLNGNGPRRAGLVLQDDLFAERLFHIRRRGPDDVVRRAAGAPLDDPREVLDRKIRRLGGGQETNGQQRDNSIQPFQFSHVHTS